MSLRYSPGFSDEEARRVFCNIFRKSLYIIDFKVGDEIRFVAGKNEAGSWEARKLLNHLLRRDAPDEEDDEEEEDDD